MSCVHCARFYYTGMANMQLLSQVKTGNLKITHSEKSALDGEKHWVLWDLMVQALPRLVDRGRLQVTPDLDLQNV